MTGFFIQNLMPMLGLLAFAVALTAASFWSAGRLAPWFLGEGVQTPNLPTLIFSRDNSPDFFRVRVAVLGLAMAVLLAALLAIVAGARMTGWSPAF